MLGSLGDARRSRSRSIAGFNRRRRAAQFVTDVVWIRALGIHYKLGLDGLNVFLVALTTFVFALALLAANLRTWDARRSSSTCCSALAETAVLGAFCAQDLALFVAFFDLMLIPFYFLTGIWGGPATACAATTKLVIYTLVGSLLMLAAAVAHGGADRAASGNAIDVHARRRSQRLPLSRGSQEWIFLLLRGRLPGEDAGLPVPRLAARRLQGDADRRRSRSSPACSRRSPPTGSCAIVLPLFPDASRALPDADAADRAGLDPVRLGDGVHARPTRGS